MSIEYFVGKIFQRFQHFIIKFHPCKTFRVFYEGEKKRIANFYSYIAQVLVIFPLLFIETYIFYDDRLDLHKHILEYIRDRKKVALDSGIRITEMGKNHQEADWINCRIQVVVVQWWETAEVQRRIFETIESR